MNTLIQCLYCKHYWWSNADDECKHCKAVEVKRQTELATQLTEEDKALLNLLAKE